MAIQIENVVDKVEAVNIDTMPSIQVRNVRTVIDDGEVIARTYQRRTIVQGDDWSGEPQQVRDVCAIFLTQ